MCSLIRFEVETQWSVQVLKTGFSCKSAVHTVTAAQAHIYLTKLHASTPAPPSLEEKNQSFFKRETKQ